jgi:hypothetical protein
MPRMASTKYEIYLEKGKKRSFACAIDWPGWCRSGKTADDAIATLLAYGERYAKVTRRAKLRFSPPSDADQLQVTGKLKGNASTEFGIPGTPHKADAAPLDKRQLQRQLKLLEACWQIFDLAADAARGVKLRTGPRAGGRSLPKIVSHVLEAEEAYLGGLGAKLPRDGKTSGAETRLRSAVRDALTARVEGRPVAVPRNTKKPWSPRYFVRRATWHLLDHAWEIEDRSMPDKAT